MPKQTPPKQSDINTVWENTSPVNKLVTCKQTSCDLAFDEVVKHCRSRNRYFFFIALYIFMRVAEMWEKFAYSTGEYI